MSVSWSEDLVAEAFQRTERKDKVTDENWSDEAVGEKEVDVFEMMFNALLFCGHQYAKDEAEAFDSMSIVVVDINAESF